MVVHSWRYNTYRYFHKCSINYYIITSNVFIVEVLIWDHLKIEPLKRKNSFINNCYEWLFSEEERRPLAYIVAFFMIVLISTVVCLFIVTIDRHMNGIVLWMFN